MSALSGTFTALFMPELLYLIALYFTGVVVIVSTPRSWHASTLLQSVFTVSSPTPHHSHFAVQMQVHMTARTLANL